jgi:2-polyprenyl-3-methyl-5-hydroxy-6-metoxy-1,4-benzoquinol methylase
MSANIEAKLEFKDLISCGACKSMNLELTHDFGNVPLAGYFPKLKETQIDLIPMKLLFCKECTLHQISPDISDEYLFKEYRYISSVGMQQHFDELANWFIGACNPDKSAKILEFGCNDGPFLSALTNHGFSPVGIDPASNIVQRANNKGLRVINDFFSLDAVGRYSELQDVEFIFSSNSFAHISEISSIAEAVSASLAPNGKFIVEVQSLVALLDTTAFDFVYHEHKYYYTLESITRLMKQFNLHLEDANLIPTHGGSYRLMFGKSQTEQSFKTRELISQETSLIVDSRNISSAILKYEAELEKLDKLIETLHAEGNRIVAFGASGRANMLLGKLPRSRAFIEMVIDESPERIGRLMAQNQIQIEPLSGTDLTQYTTLVILAWNYSDVIIRKLEHADLDYLIPLPTLKKIESKHHKS